MSIGYLFWNREERRVRAGWRIVVQLATMFALLLGGQFLLSSALSGLIPDPKSATVTVQEIAAALLQFTSQLAMVVSVWLVGRYLDRRPFQGFGLHLDGRWWGDCGFGLALGALLMGLVFLVEWAAGWVRVTGLFVTQTGGLPFMPGILLPLLGYLAVGIAEEVWIRGYLLTNLAEGFYGEEVGPAAAIALATVVQAIVFGVLHAINPNASPMSTLGISLAGFLLALGYILTGELALPIGLHVTWNFFQGNVFGFRVSGTGSPVATFIDIEQAGPALWTGGAFGPEAGLMGIGAALLGSVLVLLWIRFRRGSLQLEREIAKTPAGVGH